MKLKTIQYGIQDGIAVITFDEENSPVNTMCLQWQDDLDAVAAQVAKDKDAIRGIILASAKSTFFAGADLKGVMRMKPEDATRVYVEIERIKKNFRIIETLGKPVVSCLNGTALGGGWEVALVGHHRIAVNNPKTQFGLPEVTLGLIPGGGGITKMTRQLGLMAAQPYLLESKLFGPAEAQKLGFVHALVDSDAELMPAARAWIDSVQGNAEACQHVWDRKGYKMPGGTPSQPGHRAGPGRGARLAEKNHPRPVPGPGSRAVRDGRRRPGGLRYRDAHRKPLPGRSDGQPGGEEHDQHVLLQPQRHQERAVAGRRTCRATSRRRWASWAPA
jgi:3-hydroxyacyl-CoA dehydrogenase/enoyl-CoA hydratase/3-hydroxybutyryl-CoA epimerase